MAVYLQPKDFELFRRAYDFTEVRVTKVWSHRIGDEMLCDPAYPGYFHIKPGPPGFANTKLVYVSDPDAAFALKMRWG